MSFDWPRMYKWEENIERDMIDSVESYVLEYYGVEDIVDLSKEQINEIEAFCDEYEWNLLMAPGFRYVINLWEDSHYEEEENTLN